MCEKGKEDILLDGSSLLSSRKEGGSEDSSS